MAGRIFKFIFNFIFPKFSELEVLTLYYLLVLNFVVSFFTPKIPPLDAIYRMPPPLHYTVSNNIFMIFLAVFFIAISIIILINAITERKMSFLEKKLLATLYYFSLGILTIISNIELMSYYSGGIYETFEFVIFGILFLRSVVSVFLVYSLSKSGIQHLYTVQMGDEQVQFLELGGMVLVATLAFLILKNTHSFASTIVLSYFYTVSAVYLVRNLLKLRS